MDEILQSDTMRIVIVPLLIMLAGFGLEFLAIRAQGVRRGQQKYKLWLQRPDSSFHSDSPYDIEHITLKLKSRSRQADRIVDIVQLASFEDYAGVGFDLSIAALTTDIVVLYNQQKVAQMASDVAVVLAFHFAFLVLITRLVRDNQRTRPDKPEILAKLRTVAVLILGLLSVVSGFIILWRAL